MKRLYWIIIQLVTVPCENRVENLLLNSISNKIIVNNNLEELLYLMLLDLNQRIEKKLGTELFDIIKPDINDHHEIYTPASNSFYKPYLALFIIVVVVVLFLFFSSNNFYKKNKEPQQVDNNSQHALSQTVSKSDWSKIIEIEWKDFFSVVYKEQTENQLSFLMSLSEIYESRIFSKDQNLEDENPDLFDEKIVATDLGKKELLDIFEILDQLNQESED